MGDQNNVISEPRSVSHSVNVLQNETPDIPKESLINNFTTNTAFSNGRSDTVLEKYDRVASDANLEKYTKCIHLKDRGYAWVVLAAMLISNILTAGYIKAFGIIYNAVVAEFPDASGAEAGLMMGLLVGCRGILAPVAGALGVKFGSRICLTFGALLCFAGLIASYFCTSIWQLSLTLGAMIGVGICLIESIQVVVVANYFNKNLSIANGIRVSGNPIGGMIYPFILLLLAEDVGYRASRILLASIFLHILICAALFRSPETHKRIQILSVLKEFEIDKTDKRNLYKSIGNQFPDTSQVSNKLALEFHYLKNAVYWIFILSSIAVIFSFPMVIYYIPIYSRSFGLSPAQISLLLSYQSLIDAVLRIIIGYMSNKNLYTKNNGYIFCLFVGSCGTILIPFCSNEWEIYLATALVSIGSSGINVFLNIILTEQFGEASIATTWGFVRMVQGVFNFINPSLLGALVDASNSYIPSFMVMGFGMTVAAILILLEPFVIKLTKSSVVIT